MTYVDLEILRQVSRQANDLDIGDEARHRAAILFDTRRRLFIEEVERHVHANFLVLEDALQIHVQNLAPGRMTLQVLQDHGLLLLADFHVENARIKRFVLELLQDPVVVEGEVARRTAATVQDCGNFSFATQAAARTFPLVVPEFRNQIKFFSHD